MFRLICLIGGYFIGCFQTAYFVSRSMGVDLKKHGSGNLGTTNSTRVLGKKAGALTLLGDFFKTVIAFFIAYFVFKENAFLAGTYAALGVILGHDFPFYLNFSGGKGIASMFGFLLCVGVRPILIVLAIGVIGASTGYMSVGSALVSISLPIVLYLFDFSTEVVAIGAIMGALALWRHRSNFVRIKNGTENRLFKRNRRNEL